MVEGQANARNVTSAPSRGRGTCGARKVAVPELEDTPLANGDFPRDSSPPCGRVDAFSRPRAMALSVLRDDWPGTGDSSKWFVWLPSACF